MNGHNVVELHGFFRYARLATTTATTLRFPPTMQPYQPGRYGLSRPSYALLAPIPAVHHTIYTPPTNYHNVAHTNTVNRLRVFPLTNPLVYGTITQDIPIPFHHAVKFNFIGVKQNEPTNRE